MVRIISSVKPTIFVEHFRRAASATEKVGEGRIATLPIDLIAKWRTPIDRPSGI